MAQCHVCSVEELAVDSVSLISKQTGNGDGVICIGGALDRWRTVGSTNGLSSDAAIAFFLVQCYENVSSGRQNGDGRCVRCRSPLTLCCLRCSPLSHPAYPLPTTTTTTPSSIPFAPSSVSRICNHEETEEGSAVSEGTSQREAEGTSMDAKDSEVKISAGRYSVSSSGPQISVDKVTENKRSGQGGTTILEDRTEERVKASASATPDQGHSERRSAPEALIGVGGSAVDVLKCPVCSQSFTEPDHLSLHTHTHVADAIHRCDLCAASFLAVDVLEQHKLSHVDQQQHTQFRHISESSAASVGEQCLKEKMSPAATDVQDYDRSSLELNVQVTDNHTSVLEEQLITSRDDSGQIDSHDHSPGAYDSDTDIESGSTCLSARREKHTVKEEASEPSRHTQNQNQTYTQPMLDRQQSVEYKCQKRSLNFQSIASLSAHTCIHDSNGTSCSACGRTFSSSSILKKHRCQNKKRKQTAPKQYDDVVSVAVKEEHAQSQSTKRTRNKERTSAEKTSSDDTQDAHECDVCMIHCPTAEDLQRHKSAEHKEGRGFQCGQCGKVLCTMQTLAIHERTHSGAKPYQCPQCPSTFRSSSNLQAHLRTHSGHTPYLCPQCGRGFKEITHLKRHLVSHSGEKPYQCPQCDKAYVHATSLKEHLLSHSATPKSWVCHQCGKAFVNSKRLSVHLKTHNNKSEARPQNLANRRYVCQICSATYQQASSLSRHKKLHEDGGLLACVECGKTFHDKFELKKHGKVHSDATPYQCKLCSSMFQESSSLKRHLLSHCTKKPYKCPECQKAFTNSKSLQRHLQTHTRVKSHTCPQCSRTFFTPWTLRLHLQHHSTNHSQSPQGKSHVCSHCGAAYLRAHSLVRHQRLHEGKQEQSARYQCVQCDRIFGDSSHLKRHMLSHSGEKPFVCSYCGRAYADSHTLKDHMQAHSGVRSFICEVCGKAFFSAKRLKEHARSHSDQRPFQCSECSAAYKHLSGLVSHQRLHSGLRPFSCGECGKTFKDSTCYKRHQLTHSHHKPHVCQQCGKAYKDVKNLRHHLAQLHGSTS